MGDIIAFNRHAQEPDLDEMNREDLLDYLETVQAQIDRLNGQEPEDMDSEEYALWGDRHEALEDLADDIQNLLDNIGGFHG